ncbi:ABC transporter ATP-binding protein [Haloferula sp. BvORR071]|uniref:ABC transporter ATP-binding protein n=1 Tax=Haloferula sp. BvORR071 TaxID=1396141 RepID=UPI0009463673|nr:ABC transporter ATP-binding protein [Haloferula sp. BvORR071]
MSNDVVISVDKLSKGYLVGHEGPQERYQSLRDTLVRHSRNFARKTLDMARGRQIVQGDEIEEFWALKDVSFEVKRGEVLGIIGRNGAGKSTLLKILSRITEPSAGRVVLDGRVASLLEVGTGFHPELSGRENIFLNGAILGMSKAEIRRKFDEIVDFSGVEKFLDTPVKRYSSGMYVRLAFAVAAHLEPEILILDEVLAVGDADFQKKCLGKMQDVARNGRTVLFVSHNMTAIKSLCSSAILLKAGKCEYQGSIDGALALYAQNKANMLAPPEGLRELQTQGIDAPVLNLSATKVASGGSLEFELILSGKQNLHLQDLALFVVDQFDIRVATIDTRKETYGLGIKAGEQVTIHGKVESLPLIAGRYSIGLYLGTSYHKQDIRNLAHLQITEEDSAAPYSPYPAMYRGPMLLESRVEIATPMLK